MFEEWFRELTEEPTPEDIKADQALIEIAEFNQFGIVGVLTVSSVFRDFDRVIIAEKVSALATPFTLDNLASVH